MDALNLTPEELALLTEANTIFNRKRLASQVLELASRIARNILATAGHCAALLESEPATVAAYYARQQTYMASDLAALTDTAKANAITAAVQANYTAPVLIWD